VLGEPAYRERCRELAGHISRMDGPRRAALHIDHLLRTGNPLDQPDDVTDAMGRLPELAQPRVAGHA